MRKLRQVLDVLSEATVQSVYGAIPGGAVFRIGFVDFGKVEKEGTPPNDLGEVEKYLGMMNSNGVESFVAMKSRGGNWGVRLMVDGFAASGKHPKIKEAIKDAAGSLMRRYDDENGDPAKKIPRFVKFAKSLGVVSPYTQ